MGIDNGSFVTKANYLMDSFLNVETLNCLYIKKEAEVVLERLLRIGSKVLKPDEEGRCHGFDLGAHQLVIKRDVVCVVLDVLVPGFRKLGVRLIYLASMLTAVLELEK